MTQTLELPILGLGGDWPDRLYILKHTPTGKYGCYHHDGVHGLASFSTQEGAQNFAMMIPLSSMECQEVSFDEAREVAKSRPSPVAALMLLDDMDRPQIHYVR